MSTATTPTGVIDVAAVTHAIESRNAGAQLAASAPDAVVTVVDHEHPPSRPLVVQGTSELRAYLAGVCDRDMRHEVRNAVVAGDRLTVEVACSYPDGTNVLCLSISGLDSDRIAWQRVVQAWDS